ERVHYPWHQDHHSAAQGDSARSRLSVRHGDDLIHGGLPRAHAEVRVAAREHGTGKAFRQAASPERIGYPRTYQYISEPLTLTSSLISWTSKNLQSILARTKAPRSAKSRSTIPWSPPSLKWRQPASRASLES